MDAENMKNKKRAYGLIKNWDQNRADLLTSTGLAAGAAVSLMGLTASGLLSGALFGGLGGLMINFGIVLGKSCESYHSIK